MFADLVFLDERPTPLFAHFMPVLHPFPAQIDCHGQRYRDCPEQSELFGHRPSVIIFLEFGIIIEESCPEQCLKKSAHQSRLAMVTYRDESGQQEEKCQKRNLACGFAVALCGLAEHDGGFAIALCNCIQCL